MRANISCESVERNLGMDENCKGLTTLGVFDHRSWLKSNKQECYIQLIVVTQRVKMYITGCLKIPFLDSTQHTFLKNQTPSIQEINRMYTFRWPVRAPDGMPVLYATSIFCRVATLFPSAPQLLYLELAS